MIGIVRRARRSPSRRTSVAPLAALALAGLLAWPTPGSAQERGRMMGPPVEFLNEAGVEGRPFSEAVRVGRMLYLSGAIGVDAETGRLVPGGIGPETRQTMENIKATLERYGSSMEHVVKCTAMLADIAEWAAMNEVYVTFFPGPKPARSAFGTSGLALGARLEIECWAILPGGMGS